MFNLSRATEDGGGAVGKQQPVIREEKKDSSHQNARLHGERPSCGGDCFITKICAHVPASLSPKPDGGLLAIGSNTACNQNSTWMKMN